MIESELEMQFKLIEYLIELYHSTRMPVHCLRVVEQMRVLHDQVILLLDDDYCEGVVLNELAAVARRVGCLYRKETLYKMLALKRFERARDTNSFAQVFHELARQTNSGFDQFTSAFVKRSVGSKIYIKDSNAAQELYAEDGAQEVQEYLANTFNHRVR